MARKIATRSDLKFQKPMPIYPSFDNLELSKVWLQLRRKIQLCYRLAVLLPVLVRGLCVCPDDRYFRALLSRIGLAEGLCLKKLSTSRPKYKIKIKYSR